MNCTGNIDDLKLIDMKVRLAALSGELAELDTAIEEMIASAWPNYRRSSAQRATGRPMAR